MSVIFQGTAAAVLLLTLLYVVVNFLKYLTNLDVPEARNAAVTQVVTWIGAVVVLFIFSRSNFSVGIWLTETIVLHDAKFTDVMVGGLLLGSGASALYDAKKALDGTDTAATPALTRTAAPPAP